MGRGIGDIFSIAFEYLPPEVLAVLGVILAFFAIPAWIRSAKTRQIKGTVRRMVRAEPADVPALSERAFLLAGTNGELLRFLVLEARKRTLPRVEGEALNRLASLDGYAADAVSLRKAVGREEAPVRHPLEVAVVVERLLDQGMIDGARIQLDAGLATHPDNTELLSLVERVLSADLEDEIDERGEPTPTS